jgi:hypothetical protein
VDVTELETLLSENWINPIELFPGDSNVLIKNQNTNPCYQTVDFAIDFMKNMELVNVEIEEESKYRTLFRNDRGYDSYDDSDVDMDED